MTAPLVRELAEDGYPVAVTCEVLEIPRSSYSEAATRPLSARAVADAELTATITAVHADSRGTYGAPRVHAELRLGLGISCGRKRVARLMRDAGLQGVCHRRKRGQRPAPATHEDLVKRVFTADAPDRVWFTDITQHRANDGWVYCCAVIDAYTRRIVGWSIADHIRTELVVDALEMASWQRRPAPGDDPARRPRLPVHLLGVRAPPARRRPAGVHGPGRLERRQRPDRVVLVHHATRAPRPPRLVHQGRARRRDLRMDRRLVQPPPPPLHPWLPVTARVRDPSHHRGHRGMITTPKPSG